MPVSPDPEKLSEEEAELALDSAPPDTRRPFPKVEAAGAGGALATVIVFALGQAGVEVTPELAAALATLIAFGAAYLREG
jgi:hypothetical protein